MQILQVLVPQGRGQTGSSTDMNAEFEPTEPMQWIEDLGGLSFDELRDLPFDVQAGLDTSIFE